MKALQILFCSFLVFSVGALTPPFTVLGYSGSSQSINVSVINHPVTWQEASQNCFSYQFLELFAESSVDKLLEHLLDVNYLLQKLLWPIDKHLWIGYFNNGTSYLMVDGGKCVSSADLLPIFYSSGGTGCILLNIAATAATNLLYSVPCDEQHEYLCESPIRVNINSTRYEDLNVNGLSVLGIPVITLTWSSYTTCEHEMISRKLAVAAVFNRGFKTCNIYVNVLFEFPVEIQIVATLLSVTTFVKTRGHTVNIRQKNEMQTTHTNLIQNCLRSAPTLFTNTETFSSSRIRTSTMTADKPNYEETVKTTEELHMETTDVALQMQTEDITGIFTEEIPFQTSDESTMTMTDEISISTTEKVTTLQIGKTDHTDGELCNLNCCAGLPAPLNNSFIGEMVLENMRVNKTLLSSYRRKRTSVKDSRLSSAVIGYCATVILIAAGLMIIIPDLFRMVKCEKICKECKRQQASIT